jgi:uncharacterized membrane protein
MNRTRKHLPEWVKEGIITQDQEQQILAWMEAKQGKMPGLIFWISLLAGLLVGLGVLLIIAHNWDDLPHAMRLAVAMMPALAGTALMLFAALKKNQNLIWMELGSLSQLIGLGASISLISQVYHIAGSMESFLFSWLLVFTPTQIILSGRLSLLLYTILASWFVMSSGFNYSPDAHPMHIFWMLGCITVSARNVYLKGNAIAFLRVYSWFLPPLFALGMGTLGWQAKNIELLFLVYSGLILVLIILGEWLKYYQDRFDINGLRFWGRMGLFVIFSMFSYRFFWDHIIHDELFLKSNFISDKLLWIGLGLIAAGVFIFISKKNKVALADIQPDVAAVIIFVVAFFILGKFAPLAGMILTNLMMLGLGIHYLQKGVKSQSLLWLNYGLLWLFLLLIYRFSDVNQGYLARGLFFIGLGILLFFINIFVIGKKGKEQKNVG